MSKESILGNENTVYMGYVINEIRLLPMSKKYFQIMQMFQYF